MTDIADTLFIIFLLAQSSDIMSGVTPSHSSASLPGFTTLPLRSYVYRVMVINHIIYIKFDSHALQKTYSLLPRSLPFLSFNRGGNVFCCGNKVFTMSRDPFWWSRNKDITYSYTSNKSLRVILSTNTLYDGIDDFAVKSFCLSCKSTVELDPAVRHHQRMHDHA